MFIFLSLEFKGMWDFLDGQFICLEVAMIADFIVLFLFWISDRDILTEIFNILQPLCRVATCINIQLWKSHWKRTVSWNKEEVCMPIQYIIDSNTLPQPDQPSVVLVLNTRKSSPVPLEGCYKIWVIMSANKC